MQPRHPYSFARTCREWRKSWDDINSYVPGSFEIIASMTFVVPDVLKLTLRLQQYPTYFRISRSLIWALYPSKQSDIFFPSLQIPLNNKIRKTPIAGQDSTRQSKERCRRQKASSGDREYKTLASRGLEEPAHASRGLVEPFFPVVLLCQFWFWREVGFGCTYYYVLGVPYSCGVVLVFLVLA